MNPDDEYHHLWPTLLQILRLLDNPKVTVETDYQRRAAMFTLMAAADAWLLVVPNPKVGLPSNTVFVLPAKVGVVVTERLIPGIDCVYELKQLKDDESVCDFHRREVTGVVKLGEDLIVADYHVYLRRTEDEARQLMRSKVNSDETL